MSWDWNDDWEEQDEAVQQIFQVLRNRAVETYGADALREDIVQQRLKYAAERAWEDLQTSSSTKINLPYLFSQGGGPVHYRAVITRGDLEIGERLPPLPGGDVEERPAPGARSAEAVRVQFPDRTPYLTYLIMGVSILIYLLQMGSQFLLDVDLPATYGMKVNQLITAEEYWRLITPVLLHGSLVHIGFNMYALFIIGQKIERVFGPVRFILLYAIAGFAGNIGSFLFTQDPSLGSSTAIFGLLGAEGVFIYQHQRIFGASFQRRLWQIIQLAAVNLLIGLSPGIDNWGHIGGLLGGMLFTFFAGPMFQLEGLPPLLRVRDERAQETVLAAAGLITLLLIGAVGLIIRMRG